METFLYALILGAVEGLTEFLPVSSTGHLIIAGHLLGFVGEKASVFEVVIQLGAIMAVVCVYRDKFIGFVKPQKGVNFSGIRGLSLLAITTIPPGIIGLLAHSHIKTLFSPLYVSYSLFVGAILMLLIETRGEKSKYSDLEHVTFKLALAIGFFQCLALFPGFSRSGATIIGAMMLGAKRKLAAEYSFLAAVPLMCAATAYDVYKNYHIFSWNDFPLFSMGMIFSFIFALIAIKGFIALLGKLTLRPFAYYRLALAILVFYLATNNLI